MKLSITLFNNCILILLSILFYYLNTIDDNALEDKSKLGKGIFFIFIA